MPGVEAVVTADDLGYEALSPMAADFVVVATQHKGDHESMRRVLKSEVGYIALIAFDKEFLAQPLSSSGVTTLGIPIALFVIVFTVAITLFYIRRANNEFDQLTQQILKDAQSK